MLPLLLVGPGMGGTGLAGLVSSLLLSVAFADPPKP